MSILISENRKELIATCHCRCEDSLHIVIEGDDDTFSFLSYMNGNHYKEQQGAFGTLRIKLKKIMAIIRNKDYYYSDIVMTREDWQQFKAWVDGQ